MTGLDTAELKRRTGADRFEEDFAEVVFRFTGGPHVSFLTGIGKKIDVPANFASVFEHWRDKVRKRHEIPLGFSEQLLHGEDMDNVDADLMSAIYNPAHPEFVNAYIQGAKHKDLRFFVRARVGAIPQLDSPEEVALINYSPASMDDGIWYVAHLKSEYLRHTASSNEDRRLFATHSCKIETDISKNEHLFSVAKITFEPLVAGRESPEIRPPAKSSRDASVR